MKILIVLFLISFQFAIAQQKIYFKEQKNTQQGKVVYFDLDGIRDKDHEVEIKKILSEGIGVQSCEIYKTPDEKNHCKLNIIPTVTAEYIRSLLILKDVDFNKNSLVVNNLSDSPVLKDAKATPTNQDCLGAIPICQNTYSTTTSYSGTGNYSNEISSANSCLGSGEKNDVWYIFNVQAGGNLNFTIKPNNSTEDYDWAVYDLTTANCSDIATNPALEVSCNYSAQYTTYATDDWLWGCTDAVSAQQGWTGPNGYLVSGCNAQNEAIVPVAVNHTFVINVSNFSSSQNGYTIDFGASSATIFDNVPPSFQSVDTPIPCGATTLTFHFSENVKCSTASTADFTLTGPGGPYTLTNLSSPQCSVGATYGSDYNLTVSPALTASGAYTLTLVTTAGSVQDACLNTAPTRSVNFTINAITSSATKTDVSCFGGSNGTANVSASGGTTPYTFLWSGGQTTATISGQLAGTYNVTVTDFKGCSSINSVTILQPASQISVNITPTAATCGSANGSIACVVTNGTANFSYDCTGQSASLGQPASHTFAALSGGSYIVTVTDSKGCTATATTTVVAPPSPTATFSYPGNQCVKVNGILNNFSFTNTGSTGPGINHSWSFPSATSTVSFAENPSGICWLAFGNYTVSHTVTQGGCSTTETKNIAVYALPNPGLSGTNLTCNGSADGIVSANPTGGNGFSYSWSVGSSVTTSSISNLIAGTYSVTVTNSDNCVGTGFQSIIEPSVMVFSQTSTNSCLNSCTGTGSVSVTSGGTGPYTYSWTGGSNPNSYSNSNLCPGVYNVIVSDAHFCQQTANVNVTNFPDFILTPSSTNAACNSSNGSATVSVAGTSTYTYMWSNNATLSSINGVAAGAYSVTVTDAGTCTKSITVTVNSNSGPTVSIINSVDVNCFGQSTGSATANASGGSGTLGYQWDNNPSLSQLTATGLAAGTHTINVTESGSLCTASASIVIAQPTPLIASTNPLGANCGQSTGSISANASGGTPPYVSYVWNTIPVQNLQTAVNLPPGSYIVTITDTKGCTTTASGAILDIPGVSVQVKTPVMPSCFGYNNGSAPVEATGGIPNYVYTCSPGSFITTSAFLNITVPGLSAGNYSLTVTDGNNCQAIAAFTVAEPPVVVANILMSTDVSCFGGNNGSATAVGSGGSGAYTGIWSTIPQTNSLVANGLPTGSYTVTVSDQNLCTKTKNVVINQPSELALSTIKTNAHCGHLDGTAVVSAFGGTPPYSYMWSGGTGALNLNTISGLSSLGSPYTVTVTDANLCTKTASVVITDILAGTPSISTYSNVNCTGFCDGSATVSMGGGFMPFSYQWSTNPVQTTAAASNLCPGNYTVSVTDFYNCLVTAFVTITEPTQITNSFAVSKASCYGICDGKIEASYSGGTPPHSYQWSNNQITPAAINLCAGSYTVTVQDANNCTKSFSATIIQPAEIIISKDTVEDAHCLQPDGKIYISVSGGTGPYTYLWGANTGSQITEDISGLISGSYLVIVKDFNNCTKSSSYTVNNISGPTASISAFQNATCFGANDGMATVTAIGGSLQFNYTWSTIPVQHVATATGLPPGPFSITVSDVTTNCTAVANVTIIQPEELSMQITTHDVICNGESNGTVSISPVGGTSPFSFQWFGLPFPSVNDTVTGLSIGSYTVILTDTNNCSEMKNITIDQPDFVSVTASSTDLVCNDICNGTATASPNGGIAPYSFLWSNNANNQTTQTAVALCIGTYSVTVTDVNGCTSTVSTIVNAPPPIVIEEVNLLHVKCFNQSTGEISINSTGGVPGYNYLWSNGATTQNLMYIPSDNYSVTVTDYNLCTKYLDFVISQPPPLQVSTISQDETCYHSCNGTISSNVLGGQPPYTYFWSNFDTESFADSLCNGNYRLTVTDFNSCPINAYDTVLGRSMLDVLNVQTVKSTCGDANGSATIQVTGGTWSYIYHWPLGVNSVSTHASDLAAGAYTVTVTDDNNCRDSLQINISDYGAPDNIHFSVKNISCFGKHDGELQVSFSSDTNIVSITWNTSPVQQGNIATQLGPGPFSVVIVDASGCIASADSIVSQPNDVLQSAIINHTNATCFETCNGSATALAYGGTPPYIYNWGNNYTLDNITGLCGATTYNVTITDGNLCRDSSYVSITQPDSIHIGATVTDATCYGKDNGIIVINASGGNGFTYLWLPDVSSNSVAAQLAPGTYSVIVSDFLDLNCFKIESFVISQPDSIYVSLGSQSTTCGLNNGTAFINDVIQGGTFPYSKVWSPGNITTDTVYYATQGTYYLSLFDEHNCTFDTNVVVGAVMRPEIKTVDVSTVSCPGKNDGKALISMKSGVDPFTYVWSPNIGNVSVESVMSSMINELSTGNYGFTVTDRKGCSSNGAFTINQPSPINIYANGSQWICIGQHATMSASATGGTAPYFFNWINPPLANDTNQIVAPSITTKYHVMATDTNGCFSDTAEVTISVFPPITVNVTVDDTAICKGNIDSLRVFTKGGMGFPYKWYWADLQDTIYEPIRGVYPADTMIYFVSATDNCNSPSNTASVKIIVYPVPLVLIIPDSVSGCEPLEVFFRNVVEDTTVNYAWNFNDENSNNNNSTDIHPSHEFKQDGLYNVTLTLMNPNTSKKCFAGDNQEITVFPKPIANFEATPLRNMGIPNTTSLFHPTFMFDDISTELIESSKWTFGDGRTSNIDHTLHSYESAGIYPVWLYVKTNNGCVDSVMHKVTVIEEFTLYVPSAFSPNSIVNREFGPIGEGFDKSNYHLWIFDRWGELVFETQDFKEKWNGKFNNAGTEVKSGCYIWRVWVKDNYGKAHEKSGSVTLLR